MSCSFEKGFQYRSYPYRQLTEKDQEGKNVLVDFVTVLVNILLWYIIKVYFRDNRFNKMHYFFIFSVIHSIYYFVNYVKIMPIRILYCAGYIISKFIESTPPYLNCDKFFPKHTLFTESETFNKIKQEITAVLPHRNSIPLTKNTFDGENEYIGSDIDGKQKDTEDGWRIFMVSAGDDFTEGGLMNFPTLCNLVKQCPEIVSCVVSILPGKKGIPIHVGYYKGFIRYQLGVIIPKETEKCYLCVNGEKYNWKEGEDVMFDDTFAHKVYNETEDIRVVVYMDIERKFLPWWLRIFNKYIIGKFSGSKEVKAEIKKTEYQIKLN